MSAALVGTVTLGVWNLLFLLSLVSWLWYRKLPSMRFRTPGIAILQAFAALALFDLSILRDVVSIPCPVLLWIPSYCIPTILFIALLRYLQLGNRYWLNASKLNQRTRSSIIVKEEKRLLKESSVQLARQLEAGRRGSAAMERAAKWKLRVFALLNTRAAIQLGIFFLLLQSGGLAAVQWMVVNGRLPEDPVNCPTGWELVPIYAGLALVFCLTPVVLAAVRGVQDAYGIKWQLELGAALCGLSFAAAAGLDIATISHGKLVVNSYHLWAVGASTYLFICFFLPAIEAVWIARTLNRERMPGPNDEGITVSIIMADPCLLLEFRQFAVSEFMVENVLFLERYQAAKQAAATSIFGVKSSAKSDTADEISWQEEFRKLYFDFLRPNAELELAVDPTVRAQAAQRFKDKTITPETLDAVAEQVHGLISRNTYPRFLDYRRHHRRDKKSMSPSRKK